MQKLLIALLVTALTGCGAGRMLVTADKKYSPADLQKDYALYRHILEHTHPGLYWYTSKDSMDYFFDWGAAKLSDSLTEPQFRRILSYVTAKIRCGHTTIRSSKGYQRYSDTARAPYFFPLSLKLWNDTSVVTSNLNRRDSILKRGTQITAINGRPMPLIIDSLFQFLSADGYNTSHKYQTTSSLGYFGGLYTSVFGYSPVYSIDYIDSAGNAGKTTAVPFITRRDTTRRPPATAGSEPRPPQPSRRDMRNRRRNDVRMLKIDTVTHVAMMNLRSFGKGYGLKKFFRRSFKTLRENNIDNLIIDVRGNGGGSITNSTSITRYLSDHRFKTADSLYAIVKRNKYGRYIQNDFFNRLFMLTFTHRKRDGFYHLGFLERHWYKPRKKNHFSGQVYILTDGNSFSATTLFASALIQQGNVTVVGEETGGGAYGNSAGLLPDVTLPRTRVRLRLPLFRLVIDKNAPKTGHGVQPEVYAGPSIETVKKGSDYKLEKVLELIKLRGGKP